MNKTNGGKKVAATKKGVASVIQPELKHFVSDQEPYRLLDKEGNWLYKDKKPPLTVEQVKYAFKRMIFQRVMDEKMLQAQRQGRMLTFAPNLGEEALQIATALAMNKEDWLVPAFRSGLLMMERGFSCKQQLLYWNGNEAGCVAEAGFNSLPINICIGTQCSHAAGIGWSLRLDNKDAASVSFIGDGGTAEGEFYESLNFATLRKAKWVCGINNNGFAISTRTNLESSVQDLSTKAIAAGAHYIQVDGNDLFASYEVMDAALKHARSAEGGPVVVEFVTYRKGPHTTSDDPKVYLKSDEKAAGEATDPFIRTKAWLEAQKAWSDEEQKAVEEAAKAEVDAAFKEMEAVLVPSVDEVFDHTYAKLTPELAKQKEAAAKRIAGK